MAVIKENAINRYIIDTADVASLPTGVWPGSTAKDRQTGNKYVTYDGTNWVLLNEKVVLDQTTAGTTNGVVAFTGLAKISANKTLVASGDYAANDVLSESASAGTAFTFASVARANAGSGTIRRAKIMFSKASGMGLTLTARTRLRLFSAAPTSNLNDNAANTALLNADKANYIGYLDFPNCASDGGSPEANVTSGSSTLPLDYVCGASVKDIYGILSFLDAEANETASMIVTIDLYVEQN